MENNNSYQIRKAGFDGLDVAFNCRLPVWFLARLKAAKDVAQLEKASAPVFVNEGKMFHIGQTGSSGGYAYIMDTGPDGETWFIKHSEKQDWNLRVSFKSATLARLGYEGAKCRIDDRLEQFGVTGEIQESIGRVDFCFDFTADGFKINPAMVVAHARASQSEHDKRFILLSEEVADWATHWKGREVESLTIGKMPGRQICLYNKTAEVKANGKNYWYQFWKLPKGSQVWRLEVRFGKKFLKERCGITTFGELEEHLPRLMQTTLEQIRMRDPEKVNETNISRSGFHPLWQTIMGWLKERYQESLKGGLPVRVLRAERQRYAKIFEDMVSGMLISFANVCEVPPEQLNSFALAQVKKLDRLQHKNTQRFAKKWEKSANRYGLLTGHHGGQTDGYASA